MKKKVNADGSRVEFDYDSSDRLVERRAFAASDSHPEAVETFEYDGSGHLVRASNRDIAVSLERDAQGRIVRERAGAGEIVSIYGPSGERRARSIDGITTQFGYAPGGELSSVVSAAGSIEVRRDPAGREIGRASCGGFRLTQAFDHTGKLVRQSAAGADPSSSVDRIFRWNRALEPIDVSDNLWGSSSYDYNSSGLVVEARHGAGAPGTSSVRKKHFLAGDEPLEVERYSYDATKSVMAADNAGPEAPFTGPLSVWHLSRGGLVETALQTAAGVVTLKHDQQGRVVERRVDRNGFRPRTWRFRWNAFDRLIETRTPDNACWQYVYDALGRRVAKRRRATTSADAFGLAYLWDRDVLAAQVPQSADGSVSSWSNATEWVSDPLDGRPFLCRSGQDLFHIVTDHVGLPREMYDDAGKRIWSRAYRLWGVLRSFKGGRAQEDGDGSWLKEDHRAVDTDLADMCPHRFPGQLADAETGLFYNRFRYYDPLAAQYVSPDPIGLQGGSRPQAYVDTPTITIDVLGLDGRTGYQYNSFYDYNLPSNQYFASDGKQFGLANQQFIQQMNADPAFRQDMLSRYPDLNDWMQHPDMSSSPPGLTWHHDEEPGKLSLVDRGDHKDNHGIYHPTGRGGRAKWGGGDAGRRGKLDPATGAPKTPAK